MKIAEGKSLCSSCFCQQPELRHVDFEAAWDGPVQMKEDHGMQWSIDDLVICEQCLANGAKLIGFVHDEQLKAEVLSQRVRVGEQLQEITDLRNHLKNLEAAVSSKVAA